MIVRMFMPRFARLVEANLKFQTVRPVPKRTALVGEKISLREWTGRPYRSKQRELKSSVVSKVEWFELDYFDDMKVGGVPKTRLAQDFFARADGFKDADDMRVWFAETHGLPFVGVVISWE